MSGAGEESPREQDRQQEDRAAPTTPDAGAGAAAGETPPVPTDRPATSATPATPAPDPDHDLVADDAVEWSAGLPGGRPAISAYDRRISQIASARCEPFEKIDAAVRAGKIKVPGLKIPPPAGSGEAAAANVVPAMGAPMGAAGAAANAPDAPAPAPAPAAPATPPTSRPPKSFPRMSATEAELRARIPPEMLAARRWVGWRIEDPDGEGAQRKVPKNPRGGNASSTDPATWGNLASAISWFARTPDASGIGFVLGVDRASGVAFSGIDLDNCRDPKTGEIATWATEILALDGFANTYAEVSPSGTGVKAFVRGRLPDGARKKKNDWPVPGACIEIYQESRYFAVTGRAISPAGSDGTNAPAVLADGTAALAEIARRIADADAAGRAAQDAARKATGPAQPRKYVMPSTPSARPRPPLDERIARARKYIAPIPGAVSGQGGHNATVKVAAILVRGFSLPPDVARRIIEEDYNPRCDPPWSPRELDHKIDSATKFDMPDGCIVDRDADRIGPWSHGGGNGHAVVACGDGSDAPSAVDEADGDADGKRFVPHEKMLDDAETEAGKILDDGVRHFADVFAPNLIRAMAILSIHRLPRLSALKALMATKFGREYKARMVDKTIAEAAHELRKETKRAISEAQFGTPNARFPGAPLMQGMVMPDGFGFGGADEIVKASERITGNEGEKRSFETKVSDAPIFISARSKDLATGIEVMRLVWKRGKGNRWETHDAARQVVMSREIVTLSDWGFPSHAGNSVLLNEYLAAFEHVNHDVIPCEFVSSRLGWLRGADGEILGFLWGREFIRLADGAPNVTYRGADAGDEQAADGFRSAGSRDEWRETIAALGAYPRAAILVIASLAAPLIELLGAELSNFGIDLAHSTSSGKTTALRAAASVWGLPDERQGGLMASWGSTRTWVERASALFNSMPVCLDDTMRARKEEDVAKILYDSISGRGQGRGSTHGMCRTSGWTTVLLSTGERKATEYTNDAGIKARILEVTKLPFGAKDETTAPVVDAVTRGILASFGWAGPDFVRFIVARMREAPDAVAGWQARRRDHMSDYRDMGHGNSVAGRFAGYFATMSVAAELAAEAGILPWPDPVSIVEAMWEHALRGVADADIPAAAMFHVLSWADGNRQTFWGRHPQTGMGEPPQPKDGWSGVWHDDDDWEWVGFREDVLRDKLNAGKFHWSVTAAWKDADLIDADKDRLTKKVSGGYGGSRPRLVLIRRSTYDRVMGEPSQGRLAEF